MNDLLLMGSALYNYLDTNGTVPVYYQKAPQGTNPPYAVVQFVNAMDDYTFTETGLNADYAVKVVSDRKFPFDGIILYNYIHNLLQDASVTVAGYTIHRIRRESIFQYSDPQDFWNIGGNYNFDIWKT